MLKKINYLNALWALGLFLSLIFLIKFLQQSSSLIIIFLEANYFLLAFLVLLFLVHYFSLGLTTIFLTSSFGISLTKNESFMLSIIAGFYNLITPLRGGMAARALYLKKKHGFAYTKFLSSLAATYLLSFFVSSLTGLISAYYLYLGSGELSWVIFLIFLGTFISMSFIILFSPKFNETESAFLNRFIRVINGWHLIKGNRSVVLSVTLLSLLQTLITAYMLYLQFRVFGIDVSFVSALFLASIGSLALLISITPANLGVSEAITVFSALTLGIAPAESLSAALLGRAVQMIVLFILGPIFSYVLLKKK